MKQKEKYTLEELYDNLEITLTELSKQSGFSHGTLTRIRDKVPARRSTVNKLLRVFSQIYGVELSISNVEGIALEEKGKHEKPITRIVEKVEKSPTEEKPIPAISQPEDTRIRTTERKRVHGTQKNPKKSDLPDGCVLASKFAENHGVPRETFRDHMMIGLGDGLIHGEGVPEDGSVLVKDWVRYEERNKRVRKDGTIEKERYLTSDQQHAALEFWERHNVDYSECDQADCYCHTLKQENG